MYQVPILSFQFVALLAYLPQLDKSLFQLFFILAFLFAVQLTDYIVVVVHKLLHALLQLHVLCLQVGYYT